MRHWILIVNNRLQIAELPPVSSEKFALVRAADDKGRQPQLPLENDWSVLLIAMDFGDMSGMLRRSPPPLLPMGQKT